MSFEVKKDRVRVAKGHVVNHVISRESKSMGVSGDKQSSYREMHGEVKELGLYCLVR